MSLQYAKTLAKAAGLPVKTGLPTPAELNEYARLERWFSSQAAPLLATLFSPDAETIRAREIEEESGYSARRAERYKAAMQVEYARRATGSSTVKVEEKLVKHFRVEAETPGFYEWKFEGKHFRSWMGNRELAIKPPKAIGGYLAGRYPGYDVTIQRNGVIESREFVNEALIPNMVCPRYTVTLSKKLPGWYLTAERLLLEGRLLDREGAKELWDQLQAGEVQQQEYAERLAALCREAEPFDDTPSGWVDLDEQGRFIDRLPEDRPSMKTDDPYRDIEEHYKLWEDEDEEREEMDEARQVASLLGFQTSEIEEVEAVTDRVNEFAIMASGLRKQRYARNVAQHPTEGDIVEGW